MKNLAKNFVLSRTKISNSSIQVGELFITPNFEENVSEEILSEVESIVKKNFPNVKHLNGKSVKNLQHLFEDDVKTTQFFMGTLTLLTIDNVKFYVINNKTGVSNPTVSVVEIQNPVAEKVDEVVVDETAPETAVDETDKTDEVVVTEVAPETTTEVVPETTTEVVPETTTEVVPETTTEVAPETTTETVEEVAPETVEEVAPETKAPKSKKVVSKDVADTQQQNATVIEEGLK